MSRPARKLDRHAAHARKIFLHHFPDGFRDATYLDWERDYKVAAAERWEQELGQDRFDELLDAGEYDTIAHTALKIEGRTNLLFSFEKMGLRDAVKDPVGARTFAKGLYEYLHGSGDLQDRFEAWVDAVSRLPRRKSRILTWPVVTVFGMIGAPDEHIFLKPWVTRTAAETYGFDLFYESRPRWPTYASLLEFAARIKRGQRDLKPRDMIDLQSFIFVLGWDGYD